MHAAPRCPKIAPVRGIPAPTPQFVVLFGVRPTPHGIFNRPIAHAQCAALHAQRSKNFRAFKVAQPLAADALDDRGRQQDALALVAEIGRWFVEQGRLERPLDKDFYRLVRPPQAGILRQHVGHSRYVRQQVADLDVGPVAACELGQVVAGWVFKRDQSAIDEDHQCASGDWLGDRCEEKDRVRIDWLACVGFLLAGPACEDLLAVPRYCQRGRTDLARFNSSREQAEGPFELCCRHADSRWVARLQNRSVRCHRVPFL